MGIALMLFLEERITRLLGGQKLSSTSGFGKPVVIGLFVVILIGMSSVRSGSVVMVLLLLFLQCSPQALVGTDIAEVIIVTGIKDVLPFKLGNIDPTLVLGLVIGSIPGAFVGIKLSDSLSARWLRRVLCVLLLPSCRSNVGDYQAETSTAEGGFAGWMHCC